MIAKNIMLTQNEEIQIPKINVLSMVMGMNEGANVGDGAAAGALENPNVYTAPELNQNSSP